MAAIEDLFHPVVELPEPVRAERYRRLVGLDNVKDRLRREAQLLADPTRLRAWSVEHHGAELPADAAVDNAKDWVYAILRATAIASAGRRPVVIGAAAGNALPPR